MFFSINVVAIAKATFVNHCEKFDVFIADLTKWGGGGDMNFVKIYGLVENKRYYREY